MREILFRGKDKDTGEWIEGLPYIYHNGSVSIAEVGQNFHVYYEIQFDGVDPSTLGQYIGLTDKNGKKIFEGDIVNAYPYGKPERCSVAYYYGAFRCVEADNEPLTCPESEPLMESENEVEIIGNIFDNPELLEGK